MAAIPGHASIRGAKSLGVLGISVPCSHSDWLRATPRSFDLRRAPCIQKDNCGRSAVDDVDSALLWGTTGVKGLERVLFLGCGNMLREHSFCRARGCLRQSPILSSAAIRASPGTVASNLFFYAYKPRVVSMLVFCIFRL